MEYDELEMLVAPFLSSFPNLESLFVKVPTHPSAQFDHSGELGLPRRNDSSLTTATARPSHARYSSCGQHASPPQR
jgi:hypothetical protein